MRHLEQVKEHVFQILKEAELISFYSESKVERFYLTDEYFPFCNPYKVALAIFDLLISNKEVRYEMV
jgi:hypothetical protein